MWKEQLLFVAIICGCSSSEVPTVVTSYGKIVGRYLTSYSGKKYEAYQGIPYAMPPVGERRFKPPLPILPWSVDLVADHLRSKCWQHDRVPDSSGSFVKGGDEDCLYLNVFAPERKANASLPVLLWIHGGAFQYDGNEPEEESFIMDRDQLIFVTIQYRLGILGFLSTEDEIVPGNMGLKDQSLALRWVRDNIANFGGDPSRITLYGLSAGGASVHYHYFSPMSAGLFRNGVSFSGTTFGPWAQTESSRRRARELGEMMNCTTSDVERMVQCLREIPAFDLVKSQAKFSPWRMVPPIPFGPVVEKFGKDPFIDRSPLEIAQTGGVYDVPWITGVVSEEGLYPVIEWTDEAVLRDINDNWDERAPLLLDYYDTIPKENHTKLARTVRKRYFGEKPIGKDTFATLVRLVSDRWYIVGAENAARAQARANKSPVYFYWYGHRANGSMAFRRADTTEYHGVCHSDDVSLFMKNTVMTPTTNPRDMAMMNALIDFLTSFATNGKPEFNVEWPRVDPTKDLNYLHIAGPENENITAKVDGNLGQRTFWNSIGFHDATIRSYRQV